MKENNKLIIFNFWKELMGCHIGLVDAIFMVSLAIFVKPNGNRDTVSVIMFCLLGVLGLVAWIYGIWRYLTCRIVFTDKNIAFYKQRELIKSICINDVKRIIVYTITRGGKLKEAIIIDDGSFLYEGGNPYKILSLKNVKNVSWIAIQYTKKRLQKIKALLPNCLIEEFDTADWID